jgi:hypothetical protein
MIIILLLLIISIGAAVAVYFLKIKPEAEAADAVFEAEAIGRTVRYEQAKGCINIKWIKVYGREFKGGVEELISWDKPTIASSVYKKGTFVANNIHKYDSQADHMYHSECDGKLEWIEINLEKDYKITRIELKNRGDCCKERMLELKGKISILDMDRNEIWSEVIEEEKDDYSYTI